MKEFKGTQGDWRVHGNGIFPDGKSSNIAICTRQTYESNFNGTFKEDLIMDANATLIAHSPLMLDALQELMDCYEKDGHLLNYNVDTARQAINKALGKD